MSNKKIKTNDKYVLVYIYGIADYTNQKHRLDNEINGIGTFLRLHTFVFSNNENFDTGKMMSETIKLNVSADPEFIDGMMDGGSETAEIANNRDTKTKAYLKLFNYTRENYK